MDLKILVNFIDNDGNDIMPGIYVYELYFQEWDGWKNTKHGTINLVR